MCMKVQGQDFAKVLPFMAHKGLPGGSRRAARAEPSLMQGSAEWCLVQNLLEIKHPATPLCADGTDTFCLAMAVAEVLPCVSRRDSCAASGPKLMAEIIWKSKYRKVLLPL